MVWEANVCFKDIIDRRAEGPLVFKLKKLNKNIYKEGRGMNVIKLVTIIGFALFLITKLTSAKNPNSTLSEFKNLTAMPVRST